MTADEVLEAMARAFAEASPCQMTQAEAMAATRAAIRAVTERGGLVVAKVPDRIGMAGPLAGDEMRGWNAALAAVRASAVEVE